MPKTNPALLFISSSSPLVPFSGYGYRTLGILQWLVNRFTVDLVFEGKEDDLEKSFIPAEAFRRIEIVPPNRSLSRILKAVFGRLPYHHTILSHSLMEEVILRSLRKNCYSLVWLNKSVHHPIIADNCEVPFIIDQIAAEPIVWDNLIQNDHRWYAKLFFRWNKCKVIRYDRMAYRKAAGIICISKQDYDTTDRFYPGSNLIYIPQGIDPLYYRLDDAAADLDLLLFTGTGATRNVQAVKIFIKKIMPLVHKRDPRMRFLWIGNVKREEHPFLEKPWVETTGFVEHTPPYFNRGVIYVAPFDMGEGMKTKIIEAMAMGKVIVTTQIGVQGIEVEGLPFIKVCSNPESFANAILGFKGNPDLRQLGVLAREHALEKYTWDAILRPLEAFLNRCMQGGTSD